MDSSVLYAIIGGIALVLIVFAARIAMRWFIRLFVIGLILILAVGGIAWWWFNPANSPTTTQPRPASTRQSNSNRR
jgi:energy-coupling factor transporter transmembrane protein EcfT